ncbi:MAG: hypothetical protein K2H85_01065, partial [Allobaculum sp.]|nr:hypothetical protein [Allobaculum sp.]
MNNKKGIVQSGNLGSSLWTLDGEGTLTIGAGEFEGPLVSDGELKWPWDAFKMQIRRVDGRAFF